MDAWYRWASRHALHEPKVETWFVTLSKKNHELPSVTFIGFSALHMMFELYSKIASHSAENIKAPMLDRCQVLNKSDDGIQRDQAQSVKVDTQKGESTKRAPSFDLDIRISRLRRLWQACDRTHF